jgi:hypothetical protein
MPNGLQPLCNRFEGPLSEVPRVAHSLVLTETAATATVAALESAACRLLSEGTKIDSLTEAMSDFGTVAVEDRAPAWTVRADCSKRRPIYHRSAQ